jgi:cytochrome c biogenesis protein CcdA/thiol-disulfide isomerase/thioredoxin
VAGEEAAEVLELLLVGVVAGFIAGVSPCVLPVLPVVLVAGTTGPPSATVPAAAFRRRRSVAVVGGLVVSFTLVTLAGSAFLSLLGLPQDLLRDLGIAALVAVGLGLVVPRLGLVLERPFLALGTRAPRGSGSGFFLGMALGAVFVPCAGPVLAAISVVGATHRLSVEAVLLALSFAVGAAVPLLLVALGGSKGVERVGALRRNGPVLRGVGGAAMIALGIALALNVTDGLQRDLPGYTTALQNGVEGGNAVHRALATVTGESAGTLGACNGVTGLARCGQAPAFRQVTRWFNTPGGRPLSLRGLLGHVVLVDFWTYSSINCQRALPHVEAWYRRYRRDGLVVVGVHTPEFGFERVAGNVAAAIRAFGITYPVAMDNAYGTWNAYENAYWPAEYLIDATGEVRHTHFAEGDYATTETLLRHLLLAAHPGLVLPPPTGLPDTTPKEPTNPETYLGYDRLQYLSGDQPVDNTATSYHLPGLLAPATVAFGGTWDIGAEAATAGSGAELELSFQARSVYLVMGGTGSVTVGLGGSTRTLSVKGPPRLYTIVSSPGTATGTLVLGVSPGVACYDFTFG